MNELFENTKQATVSITEVKKKTGKVVDEQSKEHKEDVSGLPKHPAHISHGLKFTANTGNYNSVGANVTVTIPCGITDEEIDAANVRASELANKYLDECYSNLMQGETHHR